jgi:RimJ/RimL family protein N-acetyltransferase
VTVSRPSSLPDRLTTERLILRRWRPSDRQPFAALNADMRVMEYFPQVLNQQESDALVSRIDEHFDRHGFGLWALEIPGVVDFAGFIGLSVPRFVAHFTPCVEVGWRLASVVWGHGYAAEGARAALAFGFGELELPGIVSFTVPENIRSRRVMEKIGMTHDPADDFDHPGVRTRHVLYRAMTRPSVA